MTNPYEEGTPEYEAHRFLLTVATFQHHARGWKHDTWTEDDEAFTNLAIYGFAIPMQNTTLKNAILKNTHVMPSYFVEVLYNKLFKRKNDNYVRFIDYLKDNTKNLLNFRNTALTTILLYRNERIDSVKEKLKNEILGLNVSNRRNPMKPEEVRRNLLTFFLTYPQTMTWDEIYDMHYRDVRGYASIEEGGKRVFNTDSPWKSKKKVADFGKRYHWDEGQVIEAVHRDGNDSFNLKQQRKLMKHHVAPPHSFVIDYMLAGKYTYLLAINVNTRKAFYVTPKEIKKVASHWQVPNNFKPSAESAIDSLKKLMSQTVVHYLSMDNERAWISDAFQEFLHESPIKGYRYVVKYDVGEEFDTNDRRRLNHSTTSLIDRLIRTLRLMNYHLGGDKNISPTEMQLLIDEYNASPHTTLSKIIGKPVSPNDVDNDSTLERKIVSELQRENFLVNSKPEYQVNGTVRVYNQASQFDKVKPKLLPGYWNVVSSDGGLFELEQNGNTINVPRWMIKSEWF